ncbi:LacI family DNA-binding transcriptional regulator [Pseudonocardia xishanensis]|uniref:LacI family DNA-binding transcriptional regulator n=1 Tax=Pseudonocardia xishanensis TaxID=630995 RepID=A0ABP8S156_9PSEU
MKDVAEHAGVTLSTVSYVLNDSGPVSESRRARILDAIRVLKYTPNESARRLRKKAASTIGLVLPDLTNQFFALVAEGVELAAAEGEALVMLCAPEAINRPIQHYTRLLRGQSLDGIIYLPGGAGMALSLSLELAEAGPVVMVDERVRGFDVPTVVADSRSGAREVATHVLAQGHRRLAIIGGPQALWTSEQRLSGYREAIAAHGLHPDAVPVLEGNHREGSGAAIAARLLAAPPDERPTALLCANDLMAFGVLDYCQSAGLRVPQDVSVTGFDDIPVARLTSPGLTTVRQPAHAMGYEAAKLLFELIRTPASAPPPQPPVFTTEVQVRGSVGPAPG